ncbi:hypothetical protein [Olleya sp. 1-3]|uniref:hypothetical protein n=1 Tax=Olleya sp. 1-3 TaxID=2058323 RepID=UPI000C346546|nr:hypothetical protein [Olleya sp. 1-3]PKG52912.1 hypothetical protein CXF54_03825 [Olleya sp. 1-3]
MTVLIIVVLIVIGKFIYDSYLSNNTEERWQEYKKTNPHRARRVEASKFGAKTNKNDYKYRADMAQQKKKLISEMIKKDLTDYQIKSLIEIEDDFGEIKGNSITTLKAIDIINSNSILFKLELLKKKLELELEERELLEIIDNVSRGVINDKLGINLNEEEMEVTRRKAVSILTKRVKLIVGANHNIVIRKVQFTKYLNEAVISVDAFNSFSENKAKDFFINGKFEEATNVFTEIHVIKELGYKLQETKLATVYCDKKEEGIVVVDVISQNEII